MIAVESFDDAGAVELADGPSQIPEAIVAVARAVIAAAHCLDTAFPTDLLFRLARQRLASHFKQRVDEGPR